MPTKYRVSPFFVCYFWGGVASCDLDLGTSRTSSRTPGENFLRRELRRELRAVKW